MFLQYFLFVFKLSNEFVLTSINLFYKGWGKVYHSVWFNSARVWALSMHSSHKYTYTFIHIHTCIYPEILHLDIFYIIYLHQNILYRMFIYLFNNFNSINCSKQLKSPLITFSFVWFSVQFLYFQRFCVHNGILSTDVTLGNINMMSLLFLWHNLWFQIKLNLCQFHIRNVKQGKNIMVLFRVWQLCFKA